MSDNRKFRLLAAMFSALNFALSKMDDIKVEETEIAVAEETMNEADKQMHEAAEISGEEKLEEEEEKIHKMHPKELTHHK